MDKKTRAAAGSAASATGSDSMAPQSMLQFLARDIFLGFKNLFLPVFCQKCGNRILTEENLYFCGECWATIELVREPKCPHCGKPHSRRAGFEPVESFVCSECFAQKLWVERTHAAGLHVDVLRDAIHLLKYKGKRLAAQPLGRLLIEHVFVEIEISSYGVIVPVPLHRNRLKERGYNQSELIAEQLCRRLPGANLELALKRVTDTPSFSMLGAQQRRIEIRNAFELMPGADMRGKRVLVVDDVVTTGATTNECARVFRKAGAETVDVVAVAVAKRLE